MKRDEEEMELRWGVVVKRDTIRDAIRNSSGPISRTARTSGSRSDSLPTLQNGNATDMCGGYTLVTNTGELAEGSGFDASGLT